MLGSGLVNGRLHASDQGVPCTTYRSTPDDGEGGYQADNWAESIATLQIAIAEITDRDKFRLQGQETDADFRGVVTSGSDVVKGDGLQISATAPHHAGKKFKVLAAREPEGAYLRLFLDEQPTLKFT